MTFGNQPWLGAFAVVFGLALAGCSPSDQSQLDDEREPHFILGQSRVNAMDYQGAREAFEQSIEVNPHSAAAHYQLAMLYEQKIPDPAAAIYHYQQYLKFDPKAANADVVNDHINTCKQQLASDVMTMPTAPAAMKQIEQLTDANQRLQVEVTYYSNQLVAVQLNPIPQQNNFSQSHTPTSVSPQPAQNFPTGPKPTPAPKAHTHTVVAGETLAAIARKSGIHLNALLVVNPGLDPKKLRVGQSVNLPP